MLDNNCQILSMSGIVSMLQISACCLKSFLGVEENCNNPRHQRLPKQSWANGTALVCKMLGLGRRPVRPDYDVSCVVLLGTGYV